jgi:Flp pilus assembly protein TadG
MRYDPRKKGQRGAAVVEFAVVLPLLLVILFGIIEFGFYIYNLHMLTNASREGARVGIVASIPRVPATGANSIQSVVQNYCAGYMVTFGASNTPILNPNPPVGYSSTAAFGVPLTVRVTYQYSFLVIPDFIPGIQKLQNMQATAVMRYE